MINEQDGLRVAIETLGCKLNQAESELLARQLAEAGYRLVPPDEPADVYILNTCTVTHIADRKARHLLRMARRRNPEATVIATGCYAERSAQELARIEGVDHVLGKDRKADLLSLMETRLKPSVRTPREASRAFRTRSFVKAQDGCNNFCTYCIVPLVRGREKSLPVERVVNEVRQRVAAGYKEVVLTGTEIGSYSYEDTDLKGLVECILFETAITRLRLSSVQPQEITPELLSLWRDSRLCRHFHLSLQSGCDAVLRRMNRHYAVNDYQRSAGLIRSMVPEVAITTDVIVGFPGETDAEFEASYELCKKMAFARIHVFTYSPRPGTRAAEMPGQVPAQVKKHRSERMLRLAEESAQEFRRQFIGRTMPVLFEQRSGYWSGFTDNYIKVYVKSNEDLTNKLVPVRLGEKDVL